MTFQAHPLLINHTGQWFLMTGFHAAQSSLEYKLPTARSNEGNAALHLTLWPINTAGSTDALSRRTFGVKKSRESPLKAHFTVHSPLLCTLKGHNRACTVPSPASLLEYIHQSWNCILIFDPKTKRETRFRKPLLLQEPKPTTFLRCRCK